jgi:hypothetical protein
MPTMMKYPSPFGDVEIRHHLPVDGLCEVNIRLVEGGLPAQYVVPTDCLNNETILRTYTKHVLAFGVFCKMFYEHIDSVNTPPESIGKRLASEMDGDTQDNMTYVYETDVGTVAMLADVSEKDCGFDIRLVHNDSTTDRFWWSSEFAQTGKSADDRKDMLHKYVHFIRGMNIIKEQGTYVMEDMQLPGKYGELFLHCQHHAGFDFDD